MAVENTPIEAFFADRAASSEGALREANASRTVPTGSYTLQATKAEGKVWSNETNKREGVHFTIAIKKGEKRIGTVFPDMSWVEVRTKKGELDGKSKLWLQLTKAVYPEMKANEVKELTVQQVIDAALKYPFSGYVMEQFVTPATEEDKASGWFMDTKKRSARTPEQTVEWTKAGYPKVNTLSNVYAHKPEANV